MRRCPHRGRENMFTDRAYSQGLVAYQEPVPDDTTGDERRQYRGGSSRRGLDVESLTRQARQCAHDLVLGHRNDLATGSAYGREHFTYAGRFRRGYALRDGYHSIGFTLARDFDPRELGLHALKRVARQDYQRGPRVAA